MARATVLHVLGSAEAGAAAQSRLVAGLARSLDAERFRIAAIFLGEDGPLVEELRTAGAMAARVPWARGARDPAGAARYVRAIRTLAPALVHKHVGGPALSKLTRWTTGAVILAHVHGARAETGRRNPAAAVVSGADAIVATSQAAVADLRAPARVVPPGIAVPAQPPPLPPEDLPFVLGTAGRLAPIKGIEHLLRALPAVLDSADVVLDILGEGPAEAQLRAEATRLGIGDRVRFLGWLPDTGPALERLHLYVQPSLYEGFGIATLEAMAHGRPVIATEVGGTPELVTPGSGTLVPAGDPAALGGVISSLLADPERRRALGRAAWERSQSFTEERMVQSLAALYDELLARRRAS